MPTQHSNFDSILRIAIALLPTMQRSAPSHTTKSATQLPRHASSNPSNSSANRMALSGSISTAALLRAGESPPNTKATSSSLLNFAITDLLKSPSGADQLSRQQNSSSKSTGSLASDPNALLPLSPIRQVTIPATSSSSSSVSSPFSPNNIFAENHGQNQRDTAAAATKQQQYLERLDDPENVELFAYASTLCHRITGRYLPRSVLQNDGSAQKREIERIQRDPEFLKAIATIRVRVVYVYAFLFHPDRVSINRTT